MIRRASVCFATATAYFGRMIRSRVEWKRAAAALVLVAAAIIVPLALLSPNRNRNESASTATSCGGKRWPVKTLADPAGPGLRLDRVQATTIEALRRLPARPGGESSRGDTVERTVYRVAARLVAAKVIEDDSDIHLVIADPKTDGPMIAELPAFGCTVGATRQARLLMQRARVAFLNACGDPGTGAYAEYGRTSRATVTGLGFFDFLHGQRGVAPNAIELHPVIGFAGRCKTT
jgi:hypothetical protein